MACPRLGVVFSHRLSFVVEGTKSTKRRYTKCSIERCGGSSAKSKPIVTGRGKHDVFHCFVRLTSRAIRVESFFFFLFLSQNYSTFSVSSIYVGKIGKTKNKSITSQSFLSSDITARRVQKKAANYRVLGSVARYGPQSAASASYSRSSRQKPRNLNGSL